MKLFIRKLIAYLKIIIPFTKITIKNIKEVIYEMKKQAAEDKIIETDKKKK